MRAASERTLVLLFADDVADEVRNTVSARPHLRDRITSRQVDELIDAVFYLAEPLDPIAQAIPEIGRDRNDDYLIAHAIVGRADYLVTWDKDLLDLSTVASIPIVTPGNMVQIRRDKGIIDG